MPRLLAAIVMTWCLFAALCLAAEAQVPPKDKAAAARVSLNQGAALLQKGEIEPAIRELKRALAGDPQSAAAHMLLGQAYLALRSLSLVAEAKAELQQALDIDPGLFWARFYLAKVYIDLGRYDKAQEELETGLRERPNTAHFLSLLGEVQRKLGRHAAAVDLNKKAIAADASLTPAYYYLGLAYIDLKKQDEAIAALENSVKSPYVAPEMYLTLASLYADKRRFDEGEALCRKAIALDPARPEGHINLAQLYNLRGASDQALQELKLAIEGKTFPTSPYYQQVQADAHYETGCAYRGKRQADQAIRAFLTALDLNPNESRSHRQLAELYLRAGDIPRAYQHLLMVEKLGSTLDAAIRNEIMERLGESGRRPHS